MKTGRTSGRPLVGVAAVGLLFAALVPGAGTAVAGGGGNANVHLTKTVTDAVLSPTVGVTLVADRSSVVPGEHVSYLVTVSNTGARLVMHGVFTAQATPAADATVGAYLDDVSTATNAHCGAGGSNHGHDQWPALAGTAANLPGFTPDETPPSTTGMVLSTVPVPASGVVYPSSGDQILGTVIGAGATATWNYTAMLDLTSTQVAFVTGEVTRIRNSFHVEVSPRGNGAQPAMVDTDFCSQLFESGVIPSGAVTGAKVSVALPSGSPAQFDASSTPGLASIGSGSSLTMTAPYVVPVAGPVGSGESSGEYLARLGGLDGETLTAAATLTGSGSGGPVSVTSQPVAATEHVPVVGVTKTGPGTVAAGDQATYQIGLSNTGSADASAVTVTDAVPATSVPVTAAPPTLAAGETGSASASYVVPTSQPVGALTDTASVTWQDTIGNTYGPVSASFTSQVTHPITVGHVVLSPVTAGPDVTGTSQNFTAKVTNTDGSPASGVSVTLTSTGANATTTTGVTGADGTVELSYVGANPGDDVVQASTGPDAGSLTSNTATVSWVTPVTAVSTTAVHGEFFTGGTGPFTHQPGDTPVFEQDFPTIDFNPPHGTVPNSIGNIGTGTRPFTDVTTDPLGNFAGSVVAQGNGVQAGSGSMGSFESVFTASLVVAKPGDVTFDMYSDDGFIFGVGGGATRVSGVMQNPPTSGLSAFKGYPVMGAYNHSSSPTGNTITVNFPHAGTYLYELDYDECCGGTLSMTMSAGGLGVPPAGSLVLRPSAPVTASVGAPVNMLVTALSASGTPLGGLPVTLNVDGANTQTATGTTDSRGNATLSYTGSAVGSDQVLVGASVSGLPTVSNTTVVNWANSVPGSSSGTTPAATVSAVTPADGSIITTPTPITATITPPDGATVSSWTLTATPSRTGSVASTIASGTGTPPSPLGVVDPTDVPNGNDTITLKVTDSDGAIRTVPISVIVHGNLKPGRFSETFNDLSVPVAGIPISVQRTYDSFDHTSGDFGVGWRMSLGNYQVAANRTLGSGGWSQYTASCNLFCTTGFTTSSARNVTVTTPDGAQQIFDFTPTGGSNVFWGGAAAFTARAGTGTTGTLVVDGNASFSYNGDGKLYATGTTVFNPTRYKLTLKNGTVLILDTTSGLVSETDPSGNTVTVDGSGVHSTNGGSITIHRDTSHGNRITNIAGPAGRTVTYGYDPTTGELNSVTDVNGNVTTYAYDPSSGLFTGSVDGTGAPIVTVTYGPDGRVATIQHGTAPATQVTSDVAARTQTIIDPNGHKTTANTFDDLGDVTQSDVSDGSHTLTTVMSYDSAGRRTQVTDPAGHTQKWVFDESATPANGNLLSYKTGTGQTWGLSGYNTFGGVGQITDPTGATYVSDVYEPSSPLLASQQFTGQAASTYSYWPNGQAHVVTDPGGRTVTYGYNPAGFVTSQADSAGHTTLYSPDAAGRDLKVVDPSGRSVVYGYNGTGDRTSVTDAGTGDEWTYHYNTRDLLDTATAPGATPTSYVFNDQGLVVKRTDPSGTVTTYGYDADGNTTTETGPGGDVTTYNYNPLKQLTETDNATAEDTFGYDAAGNMASQTSCAPQPGHGPCAASTATSVQPTATIGYGYTADNQPSEVTGPGGATGYGHDSLGRLNLVTDPAGGQFVIGYNPAGRVGTMTRPNGVNDAYSYTASGDISGIDSTLGTTVINRSDYGIDPATGLVNSRTDNTGVTGYGYEPDGVLSTVTPPTGAAQGPEAFTYNNFGNRLTGPTATDTSSYQPGSRLATDSTNTYGWDADGNLATSTVTATNATTTNHYNTDHQLTSADLPTGGTVTYGYDPLGRRVTEVAPSGTTRWVWDHMNITGVYDATNTLTATTVTLPTAAAGTTPGQPTKVLEETTAGATLYPLHDALGSVTALSNHTGTITSTLSYSAYGQPTGVTTTNAVSTFTGYQYDTATGLYYAHARYYNPATGGFQTPDPVATNTYQPPLGTNPLQPNYPPASGAGLNQTPYAYSAASPTVYIDPTGMSLVESAIFAGLVGAVAGSLAAPHVCPAGTSIATTLTCEGVVMGVGAGIGVGMVFAPEVVVPLSLGAACALGGIYGVLRDGPILNASLGQVPFKAGEIGINFELGCISGAGLFAISNS